MNSSVLFREVQQFRQWWLWMLVSPGPIAIWYRTLRSLMLGSNLGPSGLELVAWVIGGMALPLLLYLIRLVTEVREDGLYLRIFPFHRSCLRSPVNGIRSYEARTYGPIGEYGGWGIRYGGMAKPTMSVDAKAFSLSSRTANESSLERSAHSSSWLRFSH